MDSSAPHRVLSRMASAALAAILFASLVPALPANAPQALADQPASSSQAASQKVRVGYINAAGYEEGGDGECKSGWGYEYLQTISYHTGWDYEYVYGNFGELMQKLQAGEIDVMGNISYTDERADKLLFSTRAQGEERYYLCVKTDNDALSSGSAETFRGKRIGVIDGLIQTKEGMQWLAERGVDVDYESFANSSQLFDALESGDIDGIFMNDATTSPSATPVVCVGSSSYYLAVPKGREDLIDEIDAAMTEIQNTNSRFNDEVKSKYSANGSGSQYLTGSEKAWLEQRGHAIDVGYLDKSLPYAATDDDGRLTGAVTALISELESSFGITVQAHPFTRSEDLIEAVKSGKVDAALPVGNDFWVAEQHGAAQSDAFAATSLTAVFTGGNVESCLDRVGCARASIVEGDVLGVRYPDASITEYETLSDCADALRTGAVHAIVIPSTSLETFRETYNIDGMKTAELPESLNLSVYVAKGDSELLNIVNKSIANAKSSIEAATLSHYSYADEGPAPVRFLKRNIVAILLAVVALLAAGSVLLLRSARRARRAEAAANDANAAKTQFLARMSHDIRTPLNGIIGLMEIGDLHPDDRERAADIRSKTKNAADHLLALLSDVLEMGKLEERDLVLENVPFNMYDVFRDVYMLSNLRAQEYSVAIAHDDGANLPYLDVVGSPVHLKRIFINLMSNAIKYNKPGGLVKCTSSMLSRKDDRVTYRFVFADTGIGMTPEFVEHIFEPFSQASDDARSTYQGTGMGMSIVHALVEKMGGSISVESNLGVGTTFTLDIPFTIDEHPERRLAPSVEGAPRSIEGMKIMLVEDNELNLEIADTLLTESGAQVTCVTDGRQAVELFASKPSGTFDAILMDIMMPVMNGYQASRAIRLSGKKDADTIVIVAMTANAFAEDAKASLEAGMNAHVAKPIDMDLLKATLSRLVR